jgi:hypothetical protein
MSAPGTVAGTPLGDPVGVALRRRRALLAIALLVLAAAAIVAIAGSGTTRGFLDPESYDDAGSRAVATLLADRGIEVVRTTTERDTEAALAEGPATLLIAIPDLLDAERSGRLAAAGASAVVLVAPSDGPALAAFAPGAAVVGAVDDGTVAPLCDWPGAQAAGDIDGRGPLYRPAAQQQACYRTVDGASLLRIDRDAGAVTSVLGAAQVLRNDALARQGNAALAVNLLGSQDRLVWYLPSLADLTGGQSSFLDLAPGWVIPAAAWLGVVVVLLAAARVRRLGPVVVEPLPTSVPAAETVEGRGRLYRRAGARERAAAELRSATLATVADRLALPRSTPPYDLALAVAQRTGRSAESTVTLLLGSAPATDHALVDLADALHRLEKELS